MNRRHFKIKGFDVDVEIESENPQSLRAAILDLESKGMNLIPAHEQGPTSRVDCWDYFEKQEKPYEKFISVEGEGYGCTEIVIQPNGGGEVGPPKEGPLSTTLLPGRDRTIRSMDTSQTPEKEVGEPTLPPPLPGRRCPYCGRPLQVSSYLNFLRCPVCPFALDLGRAPESGEAKRRSDPGNTQTMASEGLPSVHGSAPRISD